MLVPGDLLVPRESDKLLVIWKNSIDSYDDSFLCEITGDSLLLLIESKKMPREKWVSPEWEEACHVLTHTGTIGWVGSGWVKKMTDSDVPQRLKRRKKLGP